MTAADSIQTFKLAVRAIAKRHGLHATFMPKPKNGVNGSGMHINMSLKKDGKNLFSDPSDKYGLSKEAYMFIGGLMEHLRGMSVFTNPLVNSYKRLLPEFEAPVYIAWSARNRNQMIRIARALSDDKIRIELRSADAASNPYLALALCLAAGLDGIKKGLVPKPSYDENVFVLSGLAGNKQKTGKERIKAGIKRLPENLSEAIKAAEEDPFIRQVLGDDAFEKYIWLKKKEWDDYNTFVSEWELSEYLNRY